MQLLNRILAYLQLNMAWSFYYSMNNHASAVSALNMALQSFINCNDTTNINYCRSLLASWGAVVPAPSPVTQIPSNELFVQALAGLKGFPVDIQNNGGLGTLISHKSPYEDLATYSIIPFGFDSISGRPVNCIIPPTSITKDSFIVIPDKDCKFFHIEILNAN